MNHNEIGEDLQRFKAAMLIHRPFFGDILLRLPIVQDEGIATACTDGRTIRWNRRFFSSLNSAQRHYVLMHEVFHALLMHPSRIGLRDPEVWNIAADMVVNDICDSMMRDVNRLGPEGAMARPPDGIFVPIDSGSTAESLYGMILADRQKRGGAVSIKKDYRRFAHKSADRIEVVPDRDLQPGAVGRPLTQEEKKLLEEQIKRLVRNAASGDRSAVGSYYIPRELLRLTETRHIPWRQLLREHLTEALSEDASYATPERKYLHMDMILPGSCLTEDGELEDLWAFVDSSGSIGGEMLNQFLTQLYRIVKEFHCELNICYWDTEVTEVYRKIRSEKQVLECQPHHSGGTDINCVFTWMAQNRVKPNVMLILTDGYFGLVSEENRPRLRPLDTVLVLTEARSLPEYKKIGRVCSLT